MSLFTVIPQGPFESKVQKTIVPIIVWLGFDPFRPVQNHKTRAAVPQGASQSKRGRMERERELGQRDRVMRETQIQTRETDRFLSLEQRVSERGLEVPPPWPLVLVALGGGDAGE